MIDEYVYEILIFLTFIVLVLTVRRLRKEVSELKSLTAINVLTISQRVDGLVSSVYELSPVDHEDLLEELMTERSRLFHPEWLKTFLKATVHPYFSSELCRVYGIAKADEPPPDVRAPFLAVSISKRFIHILYVDHSKQRAHVCAMFSTRDKEARRLLDSLQASL
jgi:hypothetical protein